MARTTLTNKPPHEQDGTIVSSPLWPAHPTPSTQVTSDGAVWSDRRLVATATGAPDGLEDEMPSIFMQQMDPQELARKYGSFAVLNRPHTIVMLVNNPALMARFVEVVSRTILYVWSLRWVVQLLSGD
jgi:hypothetical protein